MQPTPQPNGPGPLQPPQTGGSTGPLTFRETVKKYYHEGKQDLHFHREKNRQEKAYYQQAKSQTRAVHNPDVPEYFVYGIGSQSTSMNVPGYSSGYAQGQQIPPGMAQPPPIIPKMVYPRIIPVDDIRVPLDERGMPILRNLSIKYDPITHSYKGTILDKPEKCNVPGTKKHSLVGLPKVVQFHARDVLNRDVMLYSNAYCRACGFHQLRLTP